MSALWVEITATRGSAPRDAGTAMKVTLTGTQGTIGGGALELKAITTAHKMLATGETSHVETLPLGPNLGQCCGGAVSLRYGDLPIETDRIAAQAVVAPDDTRPPATLWLWGAGHVGRAVVRACPAQTATISWIDSAPDRFPADLPAHVTAVPAADMPRLALRAPPQAHHLIFTYSHDIDLALCAALLRRGAASIGLIGSDTKWARFSKRLCAVGLDPASITCPIGDKQLGKAPDQIARGVLRALISRTDMKATG
jgi:xanthine dehydrogenase accessory factor